MAIHTYKTWQLYFEALIRGDKPFDVRKVDPERPPVKVGDTVRFFETTHYDGLKTGRSVDCKITFVLTGDNSVLPNGWFVMGWRNPCGCLSTEEWDAISEAIKNPPPVSQKLRDAVAGRAPKAFVVDDPAFVGHDLMGGDYGPIPVTARPAPLKPCDRAWVNHYGGLNAEAMIRYVREQGVELTDAQLADFKSKWLEHFEWVDGYLKGIKQGDDDLPDGTNDAGIDYWYGDENDPLRGLR